MKNLRPGPVFLAAGVGLFLLGAFALRLAFGLWCEPVQPMTDEVQTYLLGVKYATTCLWPYYGNDVIKPPDNLELLSQDPGALEGLLIGLPLRVWASPLSPFIFANIVSMAGFLLLSWYAALRLPGLPRWYIFPWVLLAPWCVHYTTNVRELSFSIPAACLFFVSFFETLPAWRLGRVPLPWANALMGLSLSAWVQLHRTWVMVIPFLALSFFLQWRESRKATGPLYFLLGFIPLSFLLLPTFLWGGFHPTGEASTFYYGFNLHNLKVGFTTLAQFLALACFEMPRFIGGHTWERFQFLNDHGLLVAGTYLWYMGFLQVLVLGGFFFVKNTVKADWSFVRNLTLGTFLWFFGCLLFTIKNPDVNLLVEMLPLVMIYSFYVWENLWSYTWPRRLLQVFLLCVVVFQTTYVFTQKPLNKSFYLQYRGKIVQALNAKDYTLVGKRRPGALY